MSSMAMEEDGRWRNVFVLCTGRCGSTTFSEALRYCTNYSAGHESLRAHVGKARFAYPAYHVEADNRLCWLLGRLEEAFGANAFYVHLRRDRDAVAKSFAARADKGIMAAYRNAILMPKDRVVRSNIDLAYDYIDTVDSNIAMFLRDKQFMRFDLEHARRDFSDFWERVGAEGDFERCLEEFSQNHNATKIAAAG